MTISIKFCMIFSSLFIKWKMLNYDKMIPEQKETVIPQASEIKANE